MPRSQRFGWPALLLLAACAGPGPSVDNWGVRRIGGDTPAIVSLSEINPAAPAATQPLQPALLRTASRGDNSVTIQVDALLAPQWMPHAHVFEPELQRALDWLPRIAPSETRALQLQLTLVDRTTRRREQRRHPATDTVLIDLLVPTDAAPASRSAVVARALGLALHETVHALRDDAASTRADDEDRASLVEACYLLDTVRAGDSLRFAVAADTADTADTADETSEFTRRHSTRASARVMAALRRASGGEHLRSDDRAGLQRARAFCALRTATNANQTVR